MTRHTHLKLAILTALTLNANGQSSLVLEPGSVYHDNDGYLYMTGTAVLSAINITTTYFNIKKLHKYDKYRSNAIFGAISGAAQTALGVMNVNATFDYAYIPISINIGVGLTTLTTSIVRLATKNPPKETSVSINLFCLPGIDDPRQSAIGVRLIKRL